jgi:hypothetical protein
MRATAAIALALVLLGATSALGVQRMVLIEEFVGTG